METSLETPTDSYFFLSCIVQLRTTLAILIVNLLSGAFAQSPTLGLTIHEETEEGYTLFSPELNNNVYLVDNCGHLVNQWTFSERPSLTAYLLEDGSVLRAGKDSLERRAWDNRLIWSYALDNNGISQHHDIEVLPNGNVLCVVRDAYTQTEMTTLGRDVSNTDATFRMDKIIELEPQGAHDANIVWQWRFRDHLVQNVNSTLPNYGLIDTSIHRLDVNFFNGYSADWTHVNGIDYNDDLNQIILSVRHLNEIIIIDHSTSTAEAATSFGGNAGHGGDFLWRWGNLEAFQQGNSDDLKLNHQHDAQWIPNGYPNAGKISVFNNEWLPTMKSAVHVINPGLNGLNYDTLNGSFLPETYQLTWEGEIKGRTMYENKKSGVHMLPNGNFFICETGQGRLTEIDTLGNILWSYTNPSGTFIQAQNEPFNGSGTIFRGTKYPTDYPAFLNKELAPNDRLEGHNSLSDACNTLTYLPNNESIYTSPFIAHNKIHFPLPYNGNVSVVSTSGKVHYSVMVNNQKTLDLHLPNGIYILKLVSEDEISNTPFWVK